MQIQRVETLRPSRKTVALFVQGFVDREQFHAAVVDRLFEQGKHAQDMPDPSAVYHERWKLIDWKGKLRIVRAAASDPDGYDVTAVDLRKWSRGRKPKERR